MDKLKFFQLFIKNIFNESENTRIIFYNSDIVCFQKKKSFVFFQITLKGFTFQILLSFKSIKKSNITIIILSWNNFFMNHSFQKYVFVRKMYEITQKIERNDFFQ